MNQTKNNLRIDRYGIGKKHINSITELSPTTKLPFKTNVYLLNRTVRCVYFHDPKTEKRIERYEYDTKGNLTWIAFFDAYNDNLIRSFSEPFTKSQLDKAKNLHGHAINLFNQVTKD